jgi:hypothetical protein
MSMTVDKQSYALAAHFLSDDDVSDLTPVQVHTRTMSLACAIQCAVEDWIEDEADRAKRKQARG